MQHVTLIYDDGSKQDAYVNTNTQGVTTTQKNWKRNYKEHLYIGFLIAGTLASTIAIIIYLKRLKHE